MKTLNITLLNWIMNEGNRTSNYTQYTTEEKDAIVNFIEEAKSKMGKGDCATFNFDGELISTDFLATAFLKGINFISYCPDTRQINITLGGKKTLMRISNSMLNN